MIPVAVNNTPIQVTNEHPLDHVQLDPVQQSNQFNTVHRLEHVQQLDELDQIDQNQVPIHVVQEQVHPPLEAVQP